jgi:hypothetical protein
MQAWQKGAWSPGSWAGTVWADDIIIGGNAPHFEWEHEPVPKKKPEDSRQTQEAVAREAEQIAQAEREQRDRKERLALNKARIILLQGEAERQELQEEIDRLQDQITAFYQEQSRLEALAAQEQELMDVMAIIMMEV